MNRYRHAIVIAGRTEEPIDDIRIQTNRSKGRFGLALCKALSERGLDVTLVAGDDLASRVGRTEDHPDFDRLYSFGSVSDLDRVIRGLAGADPDLTVPPAPIVFMAAAVSDYSPVAQEGKIRSDQDELTLTMRKTPKLIQGFRELFGRQAFIVGFKLLSGVADAELDAAAREQIRRCRLNLVVANDWKRLKPGLHPVRLVTPEGGAIPHEGPRHEIAATIVDFALKRANVRWGRSVSRGLMTAGDDVSAGALLRFAQDAKLLTGVDGNVSLRTGPALWVTPRQLDKSKLAPRDLMLAEPSEDGFEIGYYGQEGRKPSIDASVHAWLYRRMPGLKSMLHFHEAIVLEDAVTGFPYPCGCREEAEEIHAALAFAADAGRIDKHGGFAVKMADHGYLIGLLDGQDLTVLHRWKAAKEAYGQHLASIGEKPKLAALDLRPIFASARIVGVEARHREGGWSSVFLLPDARKGGLGERVLAKLIEERRFVGAHDHCGVADFYLERGYAIERSEGKLHVLRPPTARHDLRESATVCLYNPLTRTVLLGERRTSNWKGYWCCPGGQLEPGQTEEQAAWTEFLDETGISLDGLRPVASSVRYAAFDRGTRGFRIRNFLVPTLHGEIPKETAELRPVWAPIDQADEFTPMGPATRSVLRDLKRRLGPPR